MSIDRYGRQWALPYDERCRECGQPDNCGDCTHGRMTDAEAAELGATTITDEAGRAIIIGTKVNAGAGEPGYVTAITEPEETYGKVYVKWPEYDEPEGFIYHGTGWCWEGPDVCDEVEVVS